MSKYLKNLISFHISVLSHTYCSCCKYKLMYWNVTGASTAPLKRQQLYFEGFVHFSLCNMSFFLLSQLWVNAIYFWTDLQHYHELFHQDDLDSYRVQREAQVSSHSVVLQYMKSPPADPFVKWKYWMPRKITSPQKWRLQRILHSHTHLPFFHALLACLSCSSVCCSR